MNFLHNVLQTLVLIENQLERQSIREFWPN